jgi:predicted nucleotidyltransferase
MITLEEILARLAGADALRERHDVKSYGVLGPFGRRDGQIEFAAPRGDLAELLGRRVDLATLVAIRAEHREGVLRDLRRAA